MKKDNLKNEKQCVIHDVSVSLLCKDCIRDVKNLRMNDGCIHSAWASPYEQKIFAAKCPEGSCKHDKQYKPKKEQTISVDVKTFPDGKIELLFHSDCGKFGTDEILDGYKLTAKRLLNILQERDDYSEDEL